MDVFKEVTVFDQEPPIGLDLDDGLDHLGVMKGMVLRYSNSISIWGF